MFLTLTFKHCRYEHVLVIITSNKKHFMKNVKECRDVIVKKVLEQGWDTRTTHYTHVGPMTLHRCHQLHDLYCLLVVRNNLTCYSTSAAGLSTLHTVSDNNVGCHRSMCVMCSTSVPTLFQYFFTITSLHSFTFFMKCFLLLVCMLFFLLLHTTNFS